MKRAYFILFLLPFTVGCNKFIHGPVSNALSVESYSRTSKGLLDGQSNARDLDGGILGRTLSIASGVRIQFSNIAHGGSSIVEHGPNTAFREELKRSMQIDKPDFIVWIQGEADSQGPTMTEAEYYNRLKEIILYSRNFNPNVVWIIGFTSATLGTNKQAILDAQNRIVFDRLAFAGVNLDEIKLSSSMLLTPGNNDLSPAGLTEHLHRWETLLMTLKPWELS